MKKYWRLKAAVRTLKEVARWIGTMAVGSGIAVLLFLIEGRTPFLWLFGFLVTLVILIGITILILKSRIKATEKTWEHREEESEE